MSYNKVTAIIAAKIEVVGRHSNIHDAVCLFIQQADSSLYDDNDRMVRSWNLVRPDEEWRVMQDVVAMSASCESGCLQYKGSRTKAETFIAACRRAIETAPYVESLFNIGDYQIFQSHLQLPINRDDLAKRGDYYIKQLDKLLATDIKRQERYADTIVFDFPSTPEGIHSYLEYSSLGGMWCWGASGEREFDQKSFDRWAEPRRKQIPKKSKIEPGAIIDISVTYNIAGESFNRFEIVEGGRKVRGRGVRDDGSKTDAYVLTGFSKYVKEVA